MGMRIRLWGVESKWNVVMGLLLWLLLLLLLMLLMLLLMMIGFPNGLGAVMR